MFSYFWLEIFIQIRQPMYKTLLLFCACCIGQVLSAQNIYYVNQNAGGAGTGSSWTNAFIRLQQALAVAQNGDQVWVAKGVYKPTANGCSSHLM
jgi:hypothetical protein